MTPRKGPLPSAGPAMDPSLPALLLGVVGTVTFAVVGYQHRHRIPQRPNRLRLTLILLREILIPIHPLSHRAR